VRATGTARLLRGIAAAFLVAILSLAGARGIDYSPSPLERLIGLSGLIVEGTIERVNEETITAAVQDVLSGRPFADRKIEIVRYASYDERLPPPGYAPGQKFLWILSWRAESGIVGAAPRWHVSGFEGEGELAVDAGCVLLRDTLLKGLPAQEREIYGRRLRVHRYDRSLFRDAVTGYRRCFRWKPAAGKERPRPQQTCTSKELTEYRAKSPLHEELAARTLGSPPKKP